MEFRYLERRCHAIAAALLLAACGGGGGGGGDIFPGVQPAPGVAAGPDSFLLFPNPQAQPDGSLQTDTAAYAQAYYAAVDPANAKDTLARWKAANGFDSGTGTQVTAVFGDQRDLGYGRRMTGRQNPDGTVAFMVENYLVNVGVEYAYSPLNLDAAVVQDARWLVGVNAIEFSPGPGGGTSFAKFFNFNAVTGLRELTVDLDGRGDKAMPGPCITCHGGRGDALTPPDATGRPRFNLARNSASQARGDVQARLQPFEVDTFGFSATPGFTRADQEAALKAMNRMVLCTYPLPAASAFPEDACRPAAAAGEWQGAAADLIKAFYGGDGLPGAAFSDAYVPLAWAAAGQTTLYQSVVAASCRACHILRGTGAQSDLDFTSYAKFQGHADRIKAHVFDRGNMPLAKIVFDAFWGSGQPGTLAAFLEGQGLAVRDAGGAVPVPGRPVADPGPDRVIRQGATTLSAAASQYASSHVWSIVSGPDGAVPPAGAVLANPDSVRPTFNASVNGTFVLQLVAGNGAAQSAPARLALVVNDALAPAPSAIRFSDVKAVLQQPGGCTTCHGPAGTLPRPPVFFTDEDRNGDSVTGDATDDLWFHAEVRSRVNFTDVAASALLRKPAGRHHGGGLQTGFDAGAAPGQAARARYDLFLNWILNGAPQ